VDDKHLNEKIKDNTILPNRIEDIIISRKQERAVSS